MTSLQVAAHPSTRALGGATLVVMNDAIHLAQHVCKSDSQLLCAFTSPAAGPLGHMRGGEPRYCFRPPPSGSLPEECFEGVLAEELERTAQRAVIWPCCVSSPLPPPALLEQLDALVLAGCGTGSLPAALVDLLACEDGSPGDRWTTRVRCAITSRCSSGDGVDDFAYRGSRKKYESKGFVLDDVTAKLTPLQARALIILRIASDRCIRRSLASAPDAV